MRKIISVTFYAGFVSAVSYGTPISSVHGIFRSVDATSDCIARIGQNAVDVSVAHYTTADKRNLADQQYELVDLKDSAKFFWEKVGLLYKTGELSETFAKPPSNGDVYRVQEVSLLVKDDKLSTIVVRSKLSNQYTFSTTICDHLVKIGNLTKKHYFFKANE